MIFRTLYQRHAQAVEQLKKEKPQEDDTARDSQPTRSRERKEAPPGFEPGMADLQSAALPLG